MATLENTNASGQDTAEIRTRELGVALERLTGLATPFAVRAAVTLRLPELIISGTTRLDEPAGRTGTDRDAPVTRFRFLDSGAYPVCGPFQAGGVPTTWPY